jgi:hypothetical protein
VRPWRAVVAIARADFRERVRRYGFLVTLGCTLYAAYGFIPPNHSSYATLQFGGYRGIYNSAWVGTVVAMLAAVFLSLAGFYLVKNTVDHDRRSGVGMILAATPISKGLYVLGKALSNFAVLAALVGVLAIGTAAMQLVRGENRQLDPVALLTPFLLITLPVMAIIAAVAVFFEVTPRLGGGVGNVVFFFLWLVGLPGALESPRGGLDVIGFGLVFPSMAAACHRAFPAYDLGSMPFSFGLNFRASGTWDLGIFTWQGLDWTAGAVLGRLVWVGLALAMTGVASVVFDRFDTPAPVMKQRSRKRQPRDEPAGASLALQAPTAEVHLGPLGDRRHFGLTPLVLAELRLMLSGVPLGWWLVAGGLVLASLLAPLAVARHGLLAASWIWPLLLWSPLGNREERHGTAALMFSSPRPIVRPLLAQWSAGAALALALASGVVLRLGLGGDLVGLAGVIAGAFFVPALAVALGAWSGSSKLFEVVYLLWWYIGPVNRVPGLDFTVPSGSVATVLGWLAVAAACLSAAMAGRAAHVRG